MKVVLLAIGTLALVLWAACSSPALPAADQTLPEDVLIQWQSYIDQDMYDSASVCSTGEALEFVNFLRAITGVADSGRVVSITLLRDLVCEVQGDTALCTYFTKDEVGQDIADTVWMQRINQRWMVARVLDAGAPPLDSLLEGDQNLVFPGDSLDQEYE
ncbi:MAG: hypothetical protein IPL65_14700 [Lewinellaceae bacterium]|nr:hypothetical protein [Lewinellaceae bacterium]